MSIDLRNGDCLEILPSIESNSIDSIVTDPPAGISFMGKEWDHHKGGRDKWIEWMETIAKECLRVLKPGGHALVWALPRTSHWTATAWENAGFEVRDCVYHIFGSGFPKSLDISKAIDKELGAERKETGEVKTRHGGGKHSDKISQLDPKHKNTPITIPSTEQAKQWEGWGTALKPAVECWWLIRKPISEKTIAQNVLKHGTGGLAINECRVEANEDLTRDCKGWASARNEGYQRPSYKNAEKKIFGSTQGRFPANIILDGSEEVLEIFPNTTSGMMKAGQQRKATKGGGGYHGNMPDKATAEGTYGDIGNASRFFYCAKSDSSERNEGLVGAPSKRKSKDYRANDDGNKGIQSRLHGATNKNTNHHPTVKPLALMQYLVKLITKKNGTVLDPFMGSGTTGIACRNLGRNFIGIEKEKEYFEIAQKRIASDMFGMQELGE